jgi:hypothetical protein
MAPLPSVTRQRLHAAEGTADADDDRVKVFVRPNAYEPGRANIVVFNWDRPPTASVDVSAAKLKQGDSSRSQRPGLLAARDDRLVSGRTARDSDAHADDGHAGWLRHDRLKTSPEFAVFVLINKTVARRSRSSLAFTFFIKCPSSVVASTFACCLLPRSCSRPWSCRVWAMRSRKAGGQRSALDVSLTRLRTGARTATAHARNVRSGDRSVGRVDRWSPATRSDARRHLSRHLHQRLRGTEAAPIDVRGRGERVTSTADPQP